MAKKNKLNFGFPFGALQDEIIELFEAAGYKVKVDQTLQKIEISDPDITCLSARPIAISSMVERGILDVGISTEASVIEAKTKRVKEVCDLEYEKSLWGKTNVVLAVPKDSKIASVKGLRGKKIITRIPEITKEFLRKNKIQAEILYSDSLVNESKVGVTADAIVEFSRRGDVLAAYSLKVLKTLFESSVILIANPKALQDATKKKKIQELATRLRRARSQQEQMVSPYTPSGSTTHLDDIDLKILQELFEDGRKSFVEIAKDTKLSSVGVKKRIEKLLREDIVQVRGFMNIEKMYAMSAVIGVEADSKTLAELVERFQRSHFVYMLVKTSGRYNLAVGVLASDLGSLESFITKEIREKKGVKQVEVSVGELPLIPKWVSPPFYK
ncbi:ATP phosphoribosyltransferase [Patescibacteria group bacterium]|nr:ATP phosphoribosyltransferase [Patescibacteria group bacterium]